MNKINVLMVGLFLFGAVGSCVLVSMNTGLKEKVVVPEVVICCTGCQRLLLRSCTSRPAPHNASTDWVGSQVRPLLFAKTQGL